jgi:nitroreductase
VASRKLTPGEITSSVEKIRRKYDEYISKYFKPRTLREAFENRYITALRAKVDVSSFLIAEISAIEELIQREEHRVMLGPVRAGAEKEESFADKVLEENRKRIVKYPDIRFDEDAGEEVRRLVGALTDFEKDRWSELGSVLQDTMYAPNSSEMLTLDSQLRYLCSSVRDEVPSFLTRLVGQLRKFPRNYPAIEREEKDYILESAFFLNDLFMVLERVKRVYTEMPAQSMAVLADAMGYIWGVISDFRLKDFKRRRRWEREPEE